MPDWFYRTVAQRVLFSLPDRVGRGIALGLIGSLGRSGPGRRVIDFLGHMEPDERLATEAPTRAGCPVLRRAVATDGSETLKLPSGHVLPVREWTAAPEQPGAADCVSVVLQVGVRFAAGLWRVPAAIPDGLCDQVRAWRKALPASAAVVVSGGVGGPEEAVALTGAGADLILIDAGLIFNGPGLIKRCNEALLHERFSTMPPARREAAGIRDAWIWALALGAALGLGGFATMLLAFTRVLLPYDEHYLGVTWVTLQRNLPLLFDFMAHDRGTLAGVMLALGWFYGLIAGGGIRHGIHGARTAVIASALVGFASFFAFFGFGYFDTLHAFVAVVFFQLTVQIMVGREPLSGVTPGPDVEDAAWRHAQWGQIFWVVHAVGLLVAGAVILGIGMTDVFVQEDLAFLCLSAEQARELDARMIAVVAHDRATLGGMLLSAGVVTLLPMLWCFRRGAVWLWRAMFGLGALAYIPAIGIHLMVGYTDWRHLVPAFAGLALWIVGLALSGRYLRTEGAKTSGKAHRSGRAKHV